MGLKQYWEKRKFTSTPEPSGSIKKSHKHLSFVIQHHHASHLHYDFRLEMDGVLKSWAVPKGPSMNPADKRLAMMVEDHPYDYRNFEGVIPAGNYGAGKVIIWDEGTYEPLHLLERNHEKQLLQELKNGHLNIVLHGKKLRGAFSLVKMQSDRSKSGNSWLLIKKKDAFSSLDDILKQDKSVRSDKTVDEIKGEHNALI